MAERHNKQHADRHEREDYRTALIVSEILNTIPRDPKKEIKFFGPADIFPGYNWKKQKDAHPKTEEERREHYRILNAALGGTEKEL